MSCSVSCSTMKRTRAGTFSPFLPAIPLLLAWTLAGCAQRPAIGNACALGSPGSASQVTISTPALECEGRICLQFGATNPTCTSACASDDDCGNLSPGAASPACRGGFVCRAASPFGEPPCQRLCLCSDTQPAAAACRPAS
jgi:hypothetical protein